MNGSSVFKVSLTNESEKGIVGQNANNINVKFMCVFYCWKLSTYQLISQNWINQKFKIEIDPTCLSLIIDYPCLQFNNSSVDQRCVSTD